MWNGFKYWRDRCLSMANKRKMTGMELTQAVAQLGASVQALGQAVAQDMGQIMGVLSGLLQHMGLIEEFKCGSCGSDLSYPKLEGITAPTKCPHCQSDLTEDIPREEE
jgi:predicted Zn-ribbon and HTH transcriptional regulator